MVVGVAETGQMIISPLYTLWLGLINILPGIVAAIIVLIIGWFIAMILGHVVRVILEKLRVDKKMREAHLTKAIGHMHVPAILGEITKWYIFIIFLQVAVDLLSLGTLTSLLDSFVRWVPNLIAALLILLFGMVLIHFVELKIKEHSKVKGVHSVAGIIKAVLIIMLVIIALKQIGLEVSILENTFLLIVGAFAVGIALALGISLGLGMKDPAAKWFKDWKKNF